jgi:hypothetical protein
MIRCLLTKAVAENNPDVSTFLTFPIDPLRLCVSARVLPIRGRKLEKPDGRALCPCFPWLK